LHRATYLELVRLHIDEMPSLVGGVARVILAPQDNAQ
jgi:hypothetical protein